MKQFSWEIQCPLGLREATKEIILALLANIPLPKKKRSLQIKNLGNSLLLEGANENEIAYLWMHGFYFRDILRIESKDKKTSIFGRKAYIRGIKKPFSSSAPLPEDTARHLIRLSFQFAKKDKPDLVLLPFCGTGTFATELFLLQSHLTYDKLPRESNLLEEEWFPQKTFAFFQKKNASYFDSLTPVFWMDTDPALKSYFQEEKANWQKAFQVSLPWEFSLGDFRLLQPKHKDDGIIQNCFLPLNPPYGNRKKQNMNEKHLFGEIASYLEKLKQDFPSSFFYGFLLCPSETSWKICMNSMHSFEKKTIHITHGSDLRVLFFTNAI